MEKSLHSWSMPKVSGTQIYKNGCFGVFFDHPTISIEGTIPLSNNDKTLKLLADAAFIESLRKNASKKQKKKLNGCYVHVGLVQVGVKPLSRQGFNNSIILCLRDARYLKFESSLLGLVESSLNDGPIYFNCYSNLMLPLSDKNIVHALTVNLTSGARDETMAGMEPLAFSYRVYFKLLSHPYGEKALKESPLGETKLFQANIRSNSVVSRAIKWDGIQIPEIWVKNASSLEEETQNLGKVRRNSSMPR